MDIKVIIDLIKVALENGFAYGVLALGVYVTYSILDFPDLSVDGTVPLGATVSAVLILQGMNPWLSCLIAFLAGAAAGCVTGLLHVKLHIRPLLCGILVMTALLSINLMVMMQGTGGMSTAALYNFPTIVKAFPVGLIPENIHGYKLRIVVVTLALAVLCKLLMDGYLKTKSGLLLRAAGSNEQFVTMLARNPGVSKILGLAIGNGLAALAGAILTHNKGSADLQMGQGMVVIGLASVIIGTSMFRGFRWMKDTTKVIFGALIYSACLQVALAFGLPSSLLKLLQAVLFVLALVCTDMLDGGLHKRAKAVKGGR
ncbi:MAG TPA: ABC transporter permease [Firmicutes bacterium]|nr:ABC transporter permease [Bacillota bacterium]